MVESTHVRPLPRRTPRRRSGKQIVAAILDGAQLMIDERGYARMTTNEIAARAGVSIGSLYQYFPNKAAVLTALATRLEQQTLGLFREAFERCESESVATTAKAVIELLLSDRALGNLRTRHELVRHTPRNWTWETSGKVDAAVADLLAERLSRDPGVRKGDARIMAFILLHSVEAVVEAAVLYRQDLFNNATFKDELVQFVTRFLSG